MIRALTLSLAQLGDPAILRVLAKTLLVTLALLSVLGAGVWLGLAHALRGLANGTSIDVVAGVAALPLTIALGWLSFRAIAIGVIQLFGNEIVVAVERRHYPAALASARRVPFGASFAIGLGSAVRAILVNLLAAPLYVLLLITGVGTPILFLAVNAWLLGHDLADVAVPRHLDRRGLRAWKRAHRGDRFALGLIVAGLLLVPFVNLLAPVIGAGMATHLFHARRAA
jgi:CysZ protein